MINWRTKFKLFQEQKNKEFIRIEQLPQTTEYDLFLFEGMFDFCLKKLGKDLGENDTLVNVSDTRSFNGSLDWYFENCLPGWVDRDEARLKEEGSRRNGLK